MSLCKEKKIKVVLVDSGVFVKHPVFKNKDINGVFIKKDRFDNIEISNDICDNLGHGTGVYYILNKMYPDVEFFIVKIFDNEFETESDLLVYSLNYIYEKIKPQIIHLSNGVPSCENIDQLKDICKKITDSGTTIVSAFSNEGYLSYPAAFDNVIGVDMCLSCKRINEYEYVENSVVNIRAAGVTQKLPWNDGEYKVVSGTSFASPYITSKIISIMKQGITSNNEILSCLKKDSVRIHKGKEIKDIEKCFDIKKAVVFPFNKEVHSIVGYSNMLNFQLMDVYDVKYLGNVGKKISDLINYDMKKDYIIKNIDKIDWKSDFDTLIIGHTRELQNVLEKDYKRELIENCLKYNKNIYAFDNLDKYNEVLKRFKEKNLKVYQPKIMKENIPCNRFGKLKKISQPVLGIFGTSSKQGKFTLQLILRDMFEKNKYKVGQLGTEPSALLFGMDEVYPMGYDSTVEVEGFDSVAAVNYLMERIESKKCDIIIVGSQSQTIAYDTGNLRYIPISQYNFIHGCNPDGYILCVNFFDDIDYINRTINYLESVIDSKVIAIAIFPIKNDLYWSVLGNITHGISKAELDMKKKSIIKSTHKKVFVLGIKEEMKLLFESCLDYFSE